MNNNIKPCPKCGCTRAHLIRDTAHENPDDETNGQITIWLKMECSECGYSTKWIESNDTDETTPPTPTRRP